MSVGVGYEGEARLLVFYGRELECGGVMGE